MGAMGRLLRRNLRTTTRVPTFLLSRVFLLVQFFLAFLATLIGWRTTVEAYQYIPPDSPVIRGAFSPYAQGFTGYYGEPSDPRRYPVNPGNPLSPDYPRRFTDVNGRQNCPGMIGPLAGGMYYCTDKAFGYCDRRSGACFCGGGYTGLDCSACRPTHYRSTSAGSTGYSCVQKRRCPNDCSGGGRCEFETGLCICEPWRIGADCGTPICKQYDVLCEQCDDKQCRRCKEGYYVKSEGWLNEVSGLNETCALCTAFDPRCTLCTEKEGCLTCADPILKSIRRSGRRRWDAEMPVEEFIRELSITLPFGTQRPEAFDEAEPFEVVSTPLPLNALTVSCAQGLEFDTQFHCTPVTSTFRYCGHFGTISFNSPEYSVGESSRNLSVTVQRTGGGVGEVSCDYAFIYDSDASTADVTATAQYTSSQRLTFPPGVVRLQFFITIHGDVDREMNETFVIGLSNPSDGAMLGPQSKTIVTIIDDDTTSTDPPHTFAVGAGVTYDPFVHVNNYVTVFPQTWRGDNRTEVDPKDKFWYEVWDLDRQVDNTGPNGYNPRGTDGTHVLPGTGQSAQVLGVNHLHARVAPVLSEGLCTPIFTTGHHDHTGADSPLDRSNRQIGGGSHFHIEGTHQCVFNPPRSGNFSLVVRHLWKDNDGGLVGEYFENSYFQGAPKITRVDAVLNFTWGEGAITRLGTDFISVRWHGKLLPKHATGDMKYNFHMLADDNVRLWVDGDLIIDTWDCADVRFPYRAHSVYGIISAAKTFDEMPPCNETTGVVTLTGGHYHDIRVEFRELRGRASIRMGWSSADAGVKKQVVPSRNLFQVRHIKGSPFRMLVQPDRTVALETIASGKGLVDVVAGDWASFVIHPRDIRENPRGAWAEFDQFTANLTLVSHDGQGIGGGPVDASTVTFDKAKGVFNVRYRIFNSGNWSLGVFFLERNHTQSNLEAKFRHIRGSPFPVQVYEAAPTGLSSDAFGEGLYYGVAGEPHVFTIRVRDHLRNIREFHDDRGHFLVNAYHPDHLEVYPGVVRKLYGDGQEGNYSVTYVPTRTGKNIRLDVKVNSYHVANKGSPSEYLKSSPWTIEVNSTYADPLTTSAGGARSDGLKRCTASIACVFSVEVRDRFYNTRYEWSGGDGPLLSTAIHITPTGRVGPPAGGFSTADFPNAAKKECEDLGGVWDHPEGQSSSDTDMSCFHPESIVPGTVIQDYNNGTYLLEYTPRYSGINLLDVKLNGSHIFESPFSVDVADGAAKGNNSTASGKGLYHAVAGIIDHFIVQAKDEYDNRKTVPGDDFVVRLDYDADGTHAANNRPNGTFVANGTVSYVGGGRYACQYNATISGDYKLSVTLDGKHIHGSPFSPYVEPNVADPHVTVVVPYLTQPDGVQHIDSTTWPASYTSTWNGLLGGTAGYLSPFTIQAKDKFGNNRTAQQALDTFSIRLEGLSPNAGESDIRHPPPDMQLDAAYMGHDGQYNGSYWPLNAGQFDLHVLLNGEHVALSPYAVVIIPDLTNGNDCSALGPGLISATSDIETEFTIQARDVFKNPQIHGEDSFYINAIRQPIWTDSPIFYERDTVHIAKSHGQYRVRYTPKASGMYLLRIALVPPVGRHIATSRAVKAHKMLNATLGPRAVAESIESEEIKGSPFVVYVNDGAVAAGRSSAWGIGLVHSTAGFTALFYIQARDHALNNRTAIDTLSFEMLSTEPEYNGYKVSAEIKEVNVDGSIATATSGIIRHIGRGLYRCNYNATTRGNFSLSVKIGGSHIINSPFEAYVSPSYAYAGETSIGGAGIVSAAGSANLDADTIIFNKEPMGTANFTVVARDRYGNRLDRGGDNFLVRLDGPTHVHVVMKDLGAAKYRAEYIVPFNGTYRLTVALVEGQLTSTGGGLRGEYFSRHDLSVAPDYSKLDRTVDTELGIDIAAVRWRGLIIPPHNGLWKFFVEVGGTSSLGGHVLLLINGKTIVKGGVDSGASINGSLPMIGAVPYNITMEWMRYGEGTRTVALQWFGPSTSLTSHVPVPTFPTERTVIPASCLAERATHLPGSPFLVNNTDRGSGSEY